MHKRAFSVPAVDEIMKSLTDALNATLHVPRVYNITQVTYVNKQYRKWFHLLQELYMSTSLDSFTELFYNNVYSNIK